MYLFTPLFVFILLSGYGIIQLDGKSECDFQCEDDDIEIVEVKVFYESLCPASRKFYTKKLEPTVKLLSEQLDVQTYPYGNAKTKEHNGRYEITCQHGEKECYGNKLHACASDIIKNATAAVLFNACTMDPDRSGNGSDDAAVKYCGLVMGYDSKPIITCANGTRGEALLKAAGDETHELVPDLKTVPFFLINSKESGKCSKDFWNLICQEFEIMPVACHLKLSPQN